MPYNQVCVHVKGFVIVFREKLEFDWRVSGR